MQKKLLPDDDDKEQIEEEVETWISHATQYVILELYSMFVRRHKVLQLTARKWPEGCL